MRVESVFPRTKSCTALLGYKLVHPRITVARWIDLKQDVDGHIESGLMNRRLVQS